jgi:hypothetical protein
MLNKFVDISIDIGLNVVSVLIVIFGFIAELDVKMQWALVISIVFLNIARGIAHLRDKNSKNTKK